jgi:hypothetical protein
MEWYRTAATEEATDDDMNATLDGIGTTGSEGTARKRARTTASPDSIIATKRKNDCLPVVGYHLVLVGARYLTQPMAATLLQVSLASQVDNKNGSTQHQPPSLLSTRGSTNDTADRMAIQALQKHINRNNNSSDSYCPRKFIPTHHQRFVHIMEQLGDDTIHAAVDDTEEDRTKTVVVTLPTPCHVVLVTEMTAQDFCGSQRQTLLQTALQQQMATTLSWTWLQQQSVSLLVCLASTTTSPAAAAAWTNAQPNAVATTAEWLIQKSGLAVFTCCCPLDTSRRTVARLLWQRCHYMLRQQRQQQLNRNSSSSVTPMTISPFAIARLGTTTTRNTWV